MRTVLLTWLAIIAVGCGYMVDNGGFNVKLDDGTPATVFLETEFVEGQTILVVDYLSGTPALREDEVEKTVKAIWTSVEPEAEKQGLSEALIKYRYPDPEGDGNEFLGLLFEAEKMENGTWKLRRVN